MKTTPFLYGGSPPNNSLRHLEITFYLQEISNIRYLIRKGEILKSRKKIRFGDKERIKS